MTSPLEQMFNIQEHAQINIYGDGVPFEEWDNERKIEFIKDMRIAIDDELAEFMGEIGWKPWATSRHINVDAAKGELVDVFHFFMNFCLVVEMGPKELFEKYLAKNKKNIKRQEDGYDGVSSKCPGCKRALDDDAVDCTVILEGHTDAPDPEHPAERIETTVKHVRCSVDNHVYRITEY